MFINQMLSISLLFTKSPEMIRALYIEIKKLTKSRDKFTIIQCITVYVNFLIAIFFVKRKKETNKKRNFLFEIVCNSLKQYLQLCCLFVCVCVCVPFLYLFII